MNKKSINIYIAASLAMLVPSPGRFIYGLVLIIELNLLMVAGTCLCSLVKKLKMEQLQDVIILVSLVSLTILYKQFFVITYTEIAMTLGYIFFLPACSSFIIGYLFNPSTDTLPVRLKKNMKSSGIFSLNSLIFFLFRDILGYGTLTFFGTKHQIKEIIVFNSDSTSALSFFATIPGALILCGIILFIYILILEKIDIVKKAKTAEEK